MKELKAILRSLVISNAERGMSEYQLDRDFKSLEGRNIPFRDHGFQSLDAMLRTMTDVVKVMGIGTGATVYPVTSEKTQHILEMVEKSKKNKKKKPKYTAPYVRKTASNPLPKPKPVVAVKSNSYGKNNNYHYNNNNTNYNNTNYNTNNNYQHNGTGRDANAGQKRPATASSSKKKRENLTITIPNDVNEQFDMFWNAIQPVLNTSYGQNTRQQYQQQQSWGNQYGYYQNAQQYHNNCNGNQQRHTNNQKSGRKGQNEWSNKRASTPFYGNGNDFTSDCWNSYYSQFYGNEHYGGNFFTGGGCYPSLQNYYSSYGYGNFQTNMYNDGAWECNYNASYGYDQYGYFLQGMGNNYY